jgi:hypothetical protein
MNSETVTITIKGQPVYFNGDELTSPIEEAIEYLEGLKDGK